MLISKTVEIKWNPKIKKHYVDKGYTFTKMGKPVVVNVNDLTNGSAAIVRVKCDYCGNEFNKAWNRYITENNGVVKKDCCCKCKKFKIQEVSLLKYGVKSVFSDEEIKKKISKTNLEKYGSENPFSSDEIKKRIFQTNIKRYGYKSPMQSKSIKEKAASTCLRKYGVDTLLRFYVKTGSENHRWKGGIKYHRQERSTNEYIMWRKSVFNRDKYTCQCCGKRNGNGYTAILNAHHILNWKDYEDKRYDVNNGITLCKECHIDFHLKYGKRNTNQTQINEFINHGKKIC